MGGQLTDYDCVVCHAEGRINAGGDPETVGAFHGGDGGTTTVDLKNADLWDNNSPQATAVFVYDKAAVAASAGAAANWNSGNQIWREWTSGVDEVSGLPSNAGLDPFCLSCHDSDGAVNSFNSTDGGTALNPFGDTLIGNNYDTDTTASPAMALRSRVTDIKSRVTHDNIDHDNRGVPTLPNINDPPEGIYSRHAIRGQADSVYTTQQLPNTRWIQTSYAWNDASVMGCADCHTTDGANGSLGNAHGSDSEYLLKDASGGATEGQYSGFTYVCYSCHSSDYYSRGQTLNHTDNSSDWQDTVLLEGVDRRDDGKGSNIFGMACTNCHGGSGFGTIHGSSEQFTIGDTANIRNAYRFMNGASLRYFDPQDWSAASVGCWTLGAEDEWGGCSQHDRSAATWTRSVTRPLDY